MRILTSTDAVTGAVVLSKVGADGLVTLCKEIQGVLPPTTSLAASEGDAYRNTALGLLYVFASGVWVQVTVPDPLADSLAKLRRDFRRLLRACAKSILLPNDLDDEVMASTNEGA